jgi:hypothetical protein
MDSDKSTATLGNGLDFSETPGHQPIESGDRIAGLDERGPAGKGH